MSELASDAAADYEAQLIEFSACEISDAVLALETVPPGQVRHGGFLDGIQPLRAFHPIVTSSMPLPARIAAPAYPVTIADVSTGVAWRATTDADADAIATWSDCCPADAMIVLVQPEHHRCAALGGIHAARLQARGCAGVLVAGRVRDRGEIAALVGSSATGRAHHGDGDDDDDAQRAVETGRKAPFTAWTRGYSIVGQGAEGHVVAMGEEVRVGQVVVRPGDLVLCDYEEGAVVRVPADLVPQVIAWARQRREQDGQAMDWVVAGGGVGEAFRRFRSKIVI